MDSLYDWLAAHRALIETLALFALVVLGLYVAPGVLNAACLGLAPC